MEYNEFITNLFIIKDITRSDIITMQTVTRNVKHEILFCACNIFGLNLLFEVNY